MAEVHSSAGASAKDTALITLSFFVLLAGIVAFYWFDESALVIRVAMVIAGLAAAAGLMWFSVNSPSVRPGWRVDPFDLRGSVQK